jgi:hypothetical protein
MKHILFLLAAILGAVGGVEIGAEVQGMATLGQRPCSAKDQDILYEDCVVKVAAGMGVVRSRRLELRGDRELKGTCAGCGPCPECYPKGHFCFTWCKSYRRRLTVIDELAHIPKGQIQQAANKCLDRKIEEEGYTCLGRPQDLRIKIFLSE